MELRPHQKPAVNNVIRRYKDGVTRQLLSMATGTGKTIVAGEIIRRFLAGPAPAKVLFLAHRDELLAQAIEKLGVMAPQASITREQADDYADLDADVIVASVASLHEDRLNRFDWQRFGLCIVDEAHHVAADSYQRILEANGFLTRNNTKLLIGLTATPNRADGEPLSETFDEIVYEYPIAQGIRDKVLCDLIGRRVNTQVSLDQVKKSRGDFQIESLSSAVNTRERNELIVKAWKEHAADRRTLVFCVDIQHSKDLAQAFIDQNVAAEAVWGTDAERARKLDQHRVGGTRVLCNCAVLTEGYDDPGISCVLLARPTTSSLLYTQMVGRGTRQGKPNCMILDVVDQCSKTELGGLASLIGLPRKLNLDGRSVIDVQQQIDDWMDQNPDSDLSGLENLEDLKVYVESFDVIRRASVFPPEVVAHSGNTWQHAPGGGYVLMLPNKQRVTIVKNLLGQFVVSGMIQDNHERCGAGLGDVPATKPFHFTAQSFELAVQAADNELVKQGFRTIVAREAKWKKRKASPAQLKLVKRLYPQLQVPEGLTAGEASNLISKKAVTWK